MTAAVAFDYPGSRILAAWWRQLKPFRPGSLWVSHLLVHRIEALFLVKSLSSIGGLQRLLLSLLSRHPGAHPAALSQQLCCDRQFLVRLFRQLAQDNLVREDAGRWQVTSIGDEALRGCAFERTIPERRLLHFLDRSHMGQVAAFLDLHAYQGMPWRPDDTWRFDPEFLKETLQASKQWKLQHGFPVQLHELVAANPRTVVDNHDATSNSTEVLPPVPFLQRDIPIWQSVIVDSPIHIPLVVVSCRHESGAERILGFEFQSADWSLRVTEPVLAISHNWHEILTDLSVQPDEESLRQAWRDWCQTREALASIADPSQLNHREHILHVGLGRADFERFRAATPSNIRDEIWLLAGAGRGRCAVLANVACTDEPRPLRR